MGSRSSSFTLPFPRAWRHWLCWNLLAVVLLYQCLLAWEMPAWAGINDDRYDGNIFVVYAGNGSLVPPRLTLPETFKRKMPALLVYYVDDSRDCKQFAIVFSRLQEYYGRAASFIPVAVDAIPAQASYSPDGVGYYYEGAVPQTVLLDATGQVVFNQTGQVSFEALDEVLREVFDLLPRSESLELKRRSFNEFNAELAQ
ncbi:MAG: thioredoxin family protein [Chloroflexaceae bacterium]|nr:thioredoxin family protein [Chloroflexaceae bacterium]